MKKPRVLAIAGLETRIMRTDPWIVVILIIIPAILYDHEKRKTFFA
jgi:hypothetical protein